jgi:hypothetical protein
MKNHRQKHQKRRKHQNHQPYRPPLLTDYYSDIQNNFEFLIVILSFDF